MINPPMDYIPKTIVKRKGNYFKATFLLEVCKGVMFVTSGSNLLGTIFWWLFARPLPPRRFLDFFVIPPAAIIPGTLDISLICISIFSSREISEVDAQISDKSCATFSFLFCDLPWPCWFVPRRCCLFCFALLLWWVGVEWVIILTTFPTAFVLPYNKEIRCSYLNYINYKRVIYMYLTKYHSLSCRHIFGMFDETEMN